MGMRRTWVAYVVRGRAGTAELLTYQVGNVDHPDSDDLPAGRIPFGRPIEEAILEKLREQFGLPGASLIADLGVQDVRKDQEWRGFLVRPPDGLPGHWTFDTPMRGGHTLPITARWRDLSQPRPLMFDKTKWLGIVRQRVQVSGPKGLQLRAEPTEGADDKFLSGHWTAWALSRELQPQREGEAFVVEIPPDTGNLERVRSMLIQTATRNGFRVTDLATGTVYPLGHSPAEVEGLRIDAQTLDELPFDSELIRELTRLEGPLQPWKMIPPIDEQGYREDYRDETDELPHQLWKLPANQALITNLDSVVFGYLYNNDGLLISANAPTRRLERLSESRVVETESMTTIYSYESRPEWPQVLDEIGWAFIPNGPDGDWGELRVSPSRLDLLDKVRSWCRAKGRRWVERREVDGEARRVLMPEGQKA